MADVQIENGYTKIADELLEALYSTDFSEPQQRIIQFIIRYSYGCNKHAISLKNWNDLQNAGIAPAKIKSYLTQLKEAKVIFIDWNIKTIMINKDYDQWRIAPVPGYDSESVADVLKFNLTYNFSEQIIKSNKLPVSKQSLPTVNKIPTDSKQNSSPQSTPTADNSNDNAVESVSKDSIKDNIKTNIYIGDHEKEKIDLVIQLIKRWCPGVIHNLNDPARETLDKILDYDYQMIEVVILSAGEKHIGPGKFLKYVLGGLETFEYHYGKASKPKPELTDYQKAIKFMDDFAAGFARPYEHDVYDAMEQIAIEELGSHEKVGEVFKRYNLPETLDYYFAKYSEIIKEEMGE